MLIRTFGSCKYRYWNLHQPKGWLWWITSANPLGLSCTSSPLLDDVDSDGQTRGHSSGVVVLLWLVCRFGRISTIYSTWSNRFIDRAHLWLLRCCGWQCFHVFDFSDRLTFSLDRCGINLDRLTARFSRALIQKRGRSSSCMKQPCFCMKARESSHEQRRSKM